MDATTLITSRTRAGVTVSDPLTLPSDVDRVVVRLPIDESHRSDPSKSCIFTLERFDGAAWRSVARAAWTGGPLGRGHTERGFDPMPTLAFTPPIPITGQRVPKPSDWRLRGEQIRVRTETRSPLRHGVEVSGNAVDVSGRGNAISKNGSTAEVEGTNTTSVTVSFTVASATDTVMVTRLVAYSTADGTTAIPDVDYGGAALTGVGSGVHYATNEDFAGLFYKIDPTDGTDDVTVASSDSENTNWVVHVDQWDGVHQTTPFGTDATNTGTSDTFTVDVSSASGEVVLDVCGSYLSSGGPTVTVGSGQTEDAQENNSSFADSLFSSHEDGDTTVTMSWSCSASRSFWTQAAPLKPPAAGGGNTVRYSLPVMGVG